MSLIPESAMPHIRRFGWTGVVALGIVIVMLAGINPITVLTGQVSPPPPPTSITGKPATTAEDAALIAYPRYVDRATGRPCSAEEAVESLIDWRDRDDGTLRWWHRVLKPVLRHE